MNQTIKKLTKETLIYGVGNVLTRLVTFFLLPLFTNLLTPEEYGQITLIYVFLGFMNIIYHYGLDAAFMRYYSDAVGNDAKQPLFSTSLWLGVFTSTLLSILIIIFAPQLSSLIVGETIYSNLIRLCAAILFLDAVSHVPFALLRLQGRAGYFVSIKLLNVVITLFSNIYLLTIHKIGIDGVFISVTIASAFTTFTILVISFRYIRLEFNKNIYKSLLKFGLPFLPAGLASIAMESIDRYILAVLTNADTVGIYSVGYKLGIFMLLLTTAFQYAWQPFFLKAGDQPESKILFSRIFTYYMVTAIFVWISLTLFLTEIINLKIGSVWLVGPSFQDAQKIVPIIMTAYVFQGAYFNFLPGIYFKEKTNYIALITGFGALVNVGVNLILIPLYGIIGAAYATLAGHGSIAIITFFVSRKMFPVNYDWLKILLLLSSLFIALGVASFLNFTLIGKILGLIVYGIAVIILRVVSFEEMRTLLIKLIKKS